MMKLLTLLSLLILLVSVVVVSARDTSSIRVAIIGDYGRAIAQPKYQDEYDNRTGESRVADMIKNQFPFAPIDFIITNGDNNYPIGEWETIDQNIGQFFRDYIEPYRGNYTRDSTKTKTFNRFFSVYGNHDGYCDSCRGPNAPYLRYFKGALPLSETSAPTSAGGRYYDFVRGPVHFIALNSNTWEPDGINETSVQAQWVKKVLSTSTSPHRVIYMHHMPYSNDAYDGPTPELRWPFKSWGASVVSSGHSHCYQKITVDGFQYLINGLGGTIPIYPALPPDQWVNSNNGETQTWFNKTWGAQLLEADDCSMNITFRAIDGSFTDIARFDPVIRLAKCKSSNPNNNNDNYSPSSNNNNGQLGAGVAIGVAIAVVLFSSGYAAMVYWKKKRNEQLGMDEGDLSYANRREY